ncbi:L,D-transpeptidase [Parapedobacter sp. 10938]|uniref:L,D-transpeptidase n=1 Tax=Parapedobacter flavus TaxID=3110225 RepID=UPI002DBF6035|nr:L,D-transpeptidase [Parapedobacter sp. 10938]MEC3879382.1 L,D-transpeptidase [Parapedobacter sp. 10938]
MLLKFLFISLCHALTGCAEQRVADIPLSPRAETDSVKRMHVIVPRDIKVAAYFPFLDSLLSACNDTLDYVISEHQLINCNSWIIDTLASLDYYKQLELGRFIYDQREMTVFHKGDTLWIPDRSAATDVQARLDHTVIDVNIPEFKLRITEYDRVKYTFPVRVGRNAKRYLATAGRTVDLRTPIGEGEIVRIERNPWFVDPVSGRRYTTTRRDDGQRTTMPQIPWIEPMINGIRQGALIHPTSNPETLGKAYSNGCVGTAEGDAWYVYYHAPVGTEVRFRYDLKVKQAQDTLIFEDIYRLNQAHD